MGVEDSQQETLEPGFVLLNTRCTMDDGRVLSPGEEVRLANFPCAICRCDPNTREVVCETETCPTLQCGEDEGQLLEPGQCCPECVGKFICTSFSNY
ncbi:unnamed protein product [Schistosoma margrebowiei]|uniref:Uncharacterized protein n=1 Tax=Schistosoma margrebowiei TaxID=48269 RepID=A0A183LDA9_9TREM|nr:unnamed protein product [Schistosoma margrebowiei]